MNQWQKDVSAFHTLGDQPQTIDHVPNFDFWNGFFRIDLMQEELNEIHTAYKKLILANSQSDTEAKERAEAAIIDGFIDLLYVTIGSADCAGVKLDEYWDEVQRANLSKVDGSLGPTQYNEDGKIMKPPGWKPPDILGILRRHRAKQR